MFVKPVSLKSDPAGDQPTTYQSQGKHSTSKVAGGGGVCYFATPSQFSVL